jgi:hypothetical protein
MIRNTTKRFCFIKVSFRLYHWNHHDHLQFFILLVLFYFPSMNHHYHQNQRLLIHLLLPEDKWKFVWCLSYTPLRLIWKVLFSEDGVLLLTVVVIFTLLQFYAAESVPGTHCIGWPQINSRHRGENKNPQSVAHYFSQSYLGSRKVNRLVLRRICRFRDVWIIEKFRTVVFQNFAPVLYTKWVDGREVRKIWGGCNKNPCMVYLSVI